VLITCGRSKEAATPADLVVADTLDTLVLEGTRAEMLCWFPQHEISGVRRRQGIHVSAPNCPYLFHHANMITGRQVGLEKIIGCELGMRLEKDGIRGLDIAHRGCTRWRWRG